MQSPFTMFSEPNGIRHFGSILTHRLGGENELIPWILRLFSFSPIFTSFRVSRGMLWHFCRACCKIVAVLDSTLAGQRPLSGRGGSLHKP